MEDKGQPVVAERHQHAEGDDRNIVRLQRKRQHERADADAGEHEILGQQLADNHDQNLSSKQVEYARTIHGAGTDLLNLISDILDLSKVESGTVAVDAEEIDLANILDTVSRIFRHEAENRKLTFDVSMGANMDCRITTDSKRLMQVLNNLLSNAFKFTEKGGVRLSVSCVSSGWSPNHPVLQPAGTALAFEVSDTGIGIPPEKQEIIFEAFKQADASTSRKYGGTGLGLAICRELANLLGGEIKARSTPGLGSTFTLYLPLRYSGPSLPAKTRTTPPVEPRTTEKVEQGMVRVSQTPFDTVTDDREDLRPGDDTLLIVENDASYCRMLIEMAHACGFRVLVAISGVEALNVVRNYRPSAVCLDIFLPDTLGWTVLNQIKQDPATRHIPVQVVTVDEDRQHGLAAGAYGFISKATRSDAVKAALTKMKEFAALSRRRLLVVEDDAAQQLSIRALLEHGDIEIESVGSGAEALAALKEQSYDCVVLDLQLPDMSGFEVLENISHDETLRDLPVVVSTGKELTPEEDSRLHTIARSIVVKGVESPERLLDETALFLHRVVTDLPVEKQRMIERLHRSDEDLVGEPVLIVDDDVRNIFALSSVLERRGMKVVSASTGREAIAVLESTSDVSIALIDIMMPGMDGFETIRSIRQNPNYKRLPIIALTAKAMKGDREKCLEAGASDYLAKPVNTEQLLSTLRMWLHR